MLAYLLTAALSIMVIGSIRADVQEERSMTYGARILKDKLYLLGNETQEATLFPIGEPADQLVSYHGPLPQPGYERLEPSTPTRHGCFSH